MMDDSLPSYGQATEWEPWPIIASFVESADLCSAALVCRKWNDVFTPLLWGNPASHFGTENDAVYVALVRFKRTLVWARLATRELTHTLHFPPAQAEIYDGPRSEWLSDILHRLPRLQSLLVAHIPFIDHGALSSLVRLSQPNPAGDGRSTVYSLRLLDASNCVNLTPQTLANAIKLFPALLHLDLSETPSARYPVVLQSLAYNPALQILKLSGLMLGDDELRLLSKVVGRNLRSLDIRKNRITDRGVRTLIDDCIRVDTGRANGARSPSHHTSPRTQMILDSDEQDNFVRRQLTKGFSSYLGIESLAGQGLTHLYISDNAVTAGGASGLLRCKQLCVLDVGDLITQIVKAPPPRYEEHPQRIQLPDANTLVSIVEEQEKQLTYLRLNHAIVTLFSSLASPKVLELEDSSAISSAANGAIEIDSIEHTIYEAPNNAISELPASSGFCAELEGSPVLPARPPPPTESPEIQINRVNGDGTAEPATRSDVSPVLDASGGLFSPVSPMTPIGQTSSTESKRSGDGLLSVPSPVPLIPVPEDGLEVVSRPDTPYTSLSQLPRNKRTYSGVLNEHDAQSRYKQSKPHTLLPGTLGEITTLVLTSVPTKSTSPETARHIIEFVKNCADEENWATTQASVGYQMPPGPDRKAAERDLARSLFPFRKLVLEMAPEHKDTEVPWQRATHASQMLSTTLDPDCETYLNAAKDDFSFFGSEECGQPDNDGMAQIPLAAFREKMTFDPNARPQQRTGAAVKAATYDVLSEVSQFRRKKKAEHEAAVKRGSTDPVEGYWSGTIEVIRPRH